MERISCTVLVACLWLIVVRGTHLEPRRDSYEEIRPGKGLGKLTLGSTRGQMFALFPRNPDTDEEHTYPWCGPRTSIHWRDPQNQHSDGVFFYLRDDRVFQIESATPRFRTQEGITINSSPESVRKYFPDLRAFQLRHSASDVDGGRDLIYWSSAKHGIAFEFYYNRGLDERRVWTISVFPRGTEFHPQGCIVPPQEWVEIAPYSVEPPTQFTMQFRPITDSFKWKPGAAR
jgi:hypothetical protein